MTNSDNQLLRISAIATTLSVEGSQTQGFSATEPVWISSFDSLPFEVLTLNLEENKVWSMSVPETRDKPIAEKWGIKRLINLDFKNIREKYQLLDDGYFAATTKENFCCSHMDYHGRCLRTKKSEVSETPETFFFDQSNMFSVTSWSWRVAPISMYYSAVTGSTNSTERLNGLKLLRSFGFLKLILHYHVGTSFLGERRLLWQSLQHKIFRQECRCNKSGNLAGRILLYELSASFCFVESKIQLEGCHGR